MKDLQVIEFHGYKGIDSRQVAELTGKEHFHLVRDIKGYIEILGQSNFGLTDFFIESTYVSAQNKTLPCYILTRKGCDMIANKMTGEKGVLFTATYVTKFEEMEKQINKPTCLEDVLISQLQNMKELRLQVDKQSQQLANVNHRIDNLDTCNIEGNIQQRLVKMVQKYARDKGVTYSQAWKTFRANFNTAFSTNIIALLNNYKEKHSIKDLTVPSYLSIVGKLEDAIRVADKMINQ